AYLRTTAFDSPHCSPMTAARSRTKKPKYDESLCAYQRAFAGDLMRIVAELALTKDMHVLDVPCGNGFYARFLAERLGRRGRIECVDLCPGYLASARRRLQTAACAWQLCEADV